jgi:hypothetical protein
MFRQLKRLRETVKTEPNDAIGDCEYFLLPLLATGPVPYLFDSRGNPLNAEGDKITSGAELAELPVGIRNLMAEALGQDPEKLLSTDIA